MTKIRAALLDFDGTVVNEDLTSLFAEINGMRAESDRLNEEFRAGRLNGIAALAARIDMLKGVTLTQIAETLSSTDYLMPGAREMFDYFKSERIVTILASGSMVPILQHYQRMLDISFVIGSEPYMDGEMIVGMNSESSPADGFKLTGCMQILTALDIPVSQAVAVGDTIADKGMLLHAGLSIAINPKGGVQRFADHTIDSDLTKVIDLVQRF